jgi:hypothetical protein
LFHLARIFLGAKERVETPTWRELHVEKKNSFFAALRGDNCFLAGKAYLNTRETHLSVHGLSPYAFEERQEFMLFSVSSRAV